MNLRTEFGQGAVTPHHVRAIDPTRTYRDDCSLTQAAEGVLFPRHLTTDMDFPIYRKAFCRTLPLTYNSTGQTPDGYPVYLYKLQTKVFDPSRDENRCYCPPDGCLPTGLSDISPCYYSELFALSTTISTAITPRYSSPNWSGLPLIKPANSRSYTFIRRRRRRRLLR